MNSQHNKNNLDNLINFLIHPNLNLTCIEDQVKSFTYQEILELDNYFNKNSNVFWSEFKRYNNFSLENKNWFSMWPIRISARLMLDRKIAEKSYSENFFNDKSSLKVEEIITLDKNTVNLIVSGGFLNLELEKSNHPEFGNICLSSLDPNPIEIKTFISKFQSAILLLKKCDIKSYSCFIKSVSDIVPLHVEPSLTTGKCISLSISKTPGVIFLTPSPLILLAETLLHESAHCRLGAIEALCKIWKMGDIRVKSPLRSDLRPISGLFHQSYILMCLCRFYKNLISVTDDPVIFRNLRQINKRLIELKIGLKSSVDTLTENTSELTTFGVLLLEAIITEGTVS